tara:strand:- start:469 stop:729 length:261 start_codon:yes stop_codon:yes gene_type:complete
LTASFVSCVNDGNNEVDEVAPPTYCDVLINELHKHSEDYDSELYSLGMEDFFKTLNDLDKDNWINEGLECYNEYLINYGEDTTNTN